MNKERLKCIVLGLNRYVLTRREKQFAESAEQYFSQKGMLTEQQESIPLTPHVSILFQTFLAPEDPKTP